MVCVEYFLGEADCAQGVAYLTRVVEDYEIGCSYE